MEIAKAEYRRPARRRGKHRAVPGATPEPQAAE